jgi:hypothetical protein
MVYAGTDAALIVRNSYFQMERVSLCETMAVQSQSLQCKDGGGGGS